MASTDKSISYPSSEPIALGTSEIENLEGRTLFNLAMRRLRRDYLTLLAIFIIGTLTLAAITAPLISSVLDVDYRTVDPANAFQRPGAEGHILGTDDIGRDHLSRLLYAGRVSLGIGFSSAVLSIMIGVSLGLLAGYNQGGRFGVIDDLMMWFVTTLNSVPQLFLLLIISALLSPSVTTLILILSLLSWTTTMRLVRGETLSHREREYVIAARAIGASSPRIMFAQILPNIFSVIVINLAIDVGNVILVESALSFLSLGVRPPTPSWGNMLSNAQTFFTKGFFLVIYPGALIVITVLCLYLIGDGLRDAFDPQANKT